VENTYLSCEGAETEGLSAVTVCAGSTCEDVAITSGNCCLKFASNSSPGFWELVLKGRQGQQRNPTLRRGKQKPARSLKRAIWRADQIWGCESVWRIDIGSGHTFDETSGCGSAFAVRDSCSRGCPQNKSFAINHRLLLPLSSSWIAADCKISRRFGVRQLRSGCLSASRSQQMARIGRFERSSQEMWEEKRVEIVRMLR
jgi:hypothetical protein